MDDSWLRAVIFDLDGTLVDTERESAEALALFLQQRGITIDDSDREFVIGRSWNEIYQRLCERYALGTALADLILGSALQRERLMATGVRLLPGAEEVLSYLYGRVPLGMVSGSSRRELDFALSGSGLGRFFEQVLASEDYPEGKPSPVGYRLCAERLSVQPNECLVFEDSAAGISAAKRAGMRCVAVRIGNFSGQDQSLADLTIDTLREANAAFFSRVGIV